MSHGVTTASDETRGIVLFATTHTDNGLEETTQSQVLWKKDTAADKFSMLMKEASSTILSQYLTPRSSCSHELLSLYCTERVKVLMSKDAVWSIIPIYYWLLLWEISLTFRQIIELTFKNKWPEFNWAELELQWIETTKAKGDTYSNNNIWIAPTAASAGAPTNQLRTWSIHYIYCHSSCVEFLIARTANMWFCWVVAD